MIIKFSSSFLQTIPNINNKSNMQDFINFFWLYTWYFVLAFVGMLTALGFFAKLSNWIGAQSAQEVEKVVDQVIQKETGINPNTEGKS